MKVRSSSEKWNKTKKWDGGARVVAQILVEIMRKIFNGPRLEMSGIKGLEKCPMLDLNEGFQGKELKNVIFGQRKENRTGKHGKKMLHHINADQQTASESHGQIFFSRTYEQILARAKARILRSSPCVWIWKWLVKRNMGLVFTGKQGVSWSRISRNHGSTVFASYPTCSSDILTWYNNAEESKKASRGKGQNLRDPSFNAIFWEDWSLGKEFGCSRRDRATYTVFGKHNHDPFNYEYNILQFANHISKSRHQIGNRSFCLFKANA